MFSYPIGNILSKLSISHNDKVRILKVLSKIVNSTTTTTTAATMNSYYYNRSTSLAHVQAVVATSVQQLMEECTTRAFVLEIAVELKTGGRGVTAAVISANR